MPFNFGPAASGENIVFGSERPHVIGGLEPWVAFMKSQGIRRVCCLLPDEDDLVAEYRRAFSPSRVLHAPIGDFQYAEEQQLIGEILPFFVASDAAQEPVVAHCWAGSGRTGHVLAAWLVAARGVSIEQAPGMVVDVEGVRRNPYEAESELLTLDEVLGWVQKHVHSGSLVVRATKRVP
ncbi:MAG: dual specificity protein phosphatase family protein [Deltaproteobacteria bacterium]|nr:dual specificity protein phosphatase family protein [Deltaproteobacteria bacterium]